jgi:hypothetical protein
MKFDFKEQCAAAVCWLMWVPDFCNDEFRHSLINLTLSAPRYILSPSDCPNGFGCRRTNFVSRKREQCRCAGKAMRPNDVSGRSKKERREFRRSGL